MGMDERFTTQDKEGGYLRYFELFSLFFQIPTLFLFQRGSRGHMVRCAARHALLHSQLFSLIFFYGEAVASALLPALRRFFSSLRRCRLGSSCSSRVSPFLCPYMNLGLGGVK